MSRPQGKLPKPGKNGKYDARIKNWLSFVLGNVWLGYFTLAAPATLNPLFVTLIAALIFGPSVWGLFKEGPDEDSDDDSK